MKINRKNAILMEISTHPQSYERQDPIDAVRRQEMRRKLPLHNNELLLLTWASLAYSGHGNRAVLSFGRLA